MLLSKWGLVARDFKRIGLMVWEDHSVKSLSLLCETFNQHPRLPQNLLYHSWTGQVALGIVGRRPATRLCRHLPGVRRECGDSCLVRVTAATNSPTRSTSWHPPHSVSQAGISFLPTFNVSLHILYTQPN